MASGETPTAEANVEGLRNRTQIFAEAQDISRDDMSLAFEPSWATDLELLVGGEKFFPRIGEDFAAGVHP